MIFKPVTFMCVFIFNFGNFVSVDSECVDIVTCFGDFVHSVIGDYDDNSTKVDIIDISDLNNDYESNYDGIIVNKDFNSTALEDDLSKILADVSSKLKKEIEDELKVVSESNTFTTKNNDTSILVKIIDIRNIHPSVEENKLVENKHVKMTEKTSGILNGTSKTKILNNIHTNELFTKIQESKTSQERDIQREKVPKIKNTTTYPVSKTTNNTQNKKKTSANELKELIPPEIVTINKENVKVDYQTQILVKYIDVDTTTSKNAYLPKVSSTTQKPTYRNEYLPKASTIKVKNKIDQSTKIPINTLQPNTYITTKGSTPTDNKSISRNTYLPTTQKTSANTPSIEKNPVLVTEKITTVTPLTTEQNNKASNDFSSNFYNIRANEILDETYYEIQDDNTTDYPIIDYIDLYKDTTNEIVSFTTGSYEEIERNRENDLENAILYSANEMEDEYNGLHENDTIVEAFPWLAAIFVKNGTNNQFDYYCDGAIYTDRVIVTAGRCVTEQSPSLDASRFIALLGKRSLRETSQFERAHRVKEIKLHENFTSNANETANDLALLVLDEPIVWSDGIAPACFDGGEGDVVDSATTGWAASGQLTPIRFDMNKSKSCRNTSANTFCAVYGNEVPTCPSYGGAYIAKRSDWCLYGIRTGDTTDRPFCIHRALRYTSIAAYYDWLKNNAQV